MSADPSSWLNHGRGSTGFIGLRNGAGQILQATEGINWKFLSKIDYTNKSSELAALLVRLTGHTPQPFEPVQALQEFRFIADHLKQAIDGEGGHEAWLSSTAAGLILMLPAMLLLRSRSRAVRLHDPGAASLCLRRACAAVQSEDIQGNYRQSGQARLSARTRCPPHGRVLQGVKAETAGRREQGTLGHQGLGESGSQRVSQQPELGAQSPR